MMANQRRVALDRPALPEGIYKRIFDTALDGILVLSHPEGLVEAANPYLLGLIGYDIEDILGRKLWQLGFLVDKERAEKAFLALLKDDYVRYENISLKRKDGHLLEVEFVSNVYLINGGKAIQCNIRDISARIEVERALKKTQQQLVDALYRTVSCLSRLVESRDPYTMGHQSRVSQLAVAIGHKMNISSEELENLRLSGLVHDIGKIGIPVEILVKPFTLKVAEIALLHTHAAAAAQILLPLGLGGDLSKIVLEHHERVNGSGYPSGLKASEICLGAKILGVADTVEAMVNARPYRAARTVEVALQEITQNSGVLYDPAVVEACYTLFTNDGFSFSDSAPSQLNH